MEKKKSQYYAKDVRLSGFMERTDLLEPKSWPLHLIKHVPDQYLVVPIPMSLAACSPLYFLNLLDLKFRIMIGTKFISGAPLDKAMQWKVTQL